MGLLYNGDPPIKKNLPANKATDNVTTALEYNRLHPKEAAQAKIDAEAESTNAFNSWADNIETRMGNGYKLDRARVRDQFYTDPKTKKPYSEDYGYNTFNRMRAKTDYINSFKQFYRDNHLPIRGNTLREATNAFYKDYPQNAGQTYDKYEHLDPGKVAMYKDPTQFQTQRNAWKLRSAAPKLKNGGLLYKK